MKHLALFLFVFVVGIWVTKGQKSTEVDTTTNVTDPPSTNVTEINESDDSDNSTSAEGLSRWTTRRTCRVKCPKKVSYKYSRKRWCGFLRRCTRYSVRYRMVTGICIRCCKGWTGRPRRCRDVNECRRKPCPWNARCINTPGSYRCACDRGYKMGRTECIDQNECRWNPCGKYGRCFNTIGSYRCRCNRGFRWDGKTCVDINECRRRVCGRYATCYNTPGSYYCKCYSSGYQQIGNTCVDINECIKNPCPLPAKCYNYPGSYRCACKRGYQFINGQCVDNDECRYRGICDQICVNTPGSYKCLCNKGYQLVKNRYCVDINECNCNNGGCPFPYRCVNVPGYHYCDCPFGFGKRGNMCHLIIPQNKLNFTIPGNPTVIPQIHQNTTTLAPNSS